MFKSTKGSVALMAYSAMLLFALYGVLLCSNAARRYKVQGEAIKVITEVYGNNFAADGLAKIYVDNGGEIIEVD
ncbi:MAG: hypothetical protein IKK43_06195 [Clostridia bacterium]|nr:hypothetical protein [Clostridia bacterium]